MAFPTNIFPYIGLSTLLYDIAYPARDISHVTYVAQYLTARVRVAATQGNLNVEIVTGIYRHIPVLYIIVLILFIVYRQLLNKTISYLDTIFFYYS